MEYREKITDKLRKAGSEVAEFLRPGTLIKPLLGGYIIFALMDNNGCLDSDRTRETQWLHRLQGAQVKTVENVEERWRDDIFCSPMFDGYNPQVIREVIFDDGSQTTLSYRTLAWQPFMRWKNGEEFSPKVGERYEVTSRNQLVRKLE